MGRVLVTIDNNVIVYDNRAMSRKMVVPKDNITRNVFEMMNVGEKPTPVKTSKKNNVNVSLYSTGVELSFLDYFDKIVYSACISAYLNDEDGIIKLSTLYRMITGNKKAKLTSKIAQDISDSIERLASARIGVDFTNDVPEIVEDLLKLEDVERGRKLLRDNLLHVTTYPVKENEGIEVYYSVMKMPILYIVAHKRGQILNIPQEHLNIPKFRIGDGLNLNLVYILYEEIDHVKRGKRYDKIKFDTVFKRMGLDVNSKSRSQLKRVRETITEKILPYWVSQGVINDFYIDKVANRPTGFFIKW